MTKTNCTAPAMRCLAALALCATLSSFSGKLGVDSFTIYLNNKLLLKEYAMHDASIKSITLSSQAANDLLKVHYSHCGKTGTNRKLAIHDAQDNELKSWDFSNETSPIMDIAVREILGFAKKAGHQELWLRYSSSEIAEGKVLVSITVPGESNARLR